MDELLSIVARDIRAGDRFTLHGRPRTAAEPARRGPWDSVSVPFVGGGRADIPNNRTIIVTRTTEETS